MHFADALIRAELGLGGVSLEVNAGYSPGGTLAYSLLEYSRMLDRWGHLGLPVMVKLTAPSSADIDPTSTARTMPVVCSSPESLTPQWQADWIEDYLPLILAKNPVQLVIWNQLYDGDPHDFPHGGLIAADGSFKPAMQTLQNLRHQYLM